MRVPPIAGPSTLECTPTSIQARDDRSNRTTTCSPSQPRSSSSNIGSSLGPPGTSTRVGRARGPPHVVRSVGVAEGPRLDASVHVAVTVAGRSLFVLGLLHDGRL